jgi:ABC-type multidrug transport system ATPase subunit
LKELETIREPDMKPQLKSEYAVEAEGLKKSFGYHRVLTGVSFKVHRGEHLVILGGNGCGKTTLINILATICRPSQGKVVIEGQDIRQQATGVRRKLGVVAHTTMLYSGLTITENLRFYGRMYGVAALEERIKEMISRFDLAKWHNYRVNNLSRGIQQRTAIARALIHEPSVLMLDEPESGLDPTTLILLGNILDGLKQRGCTIIATSHNLDFALSTCSRLAVLAKGQFVYESTDRGIALSTLKEVFSQYSEYKS